MRSEAELFWILLRRAHRDGEIVRGPFELKMPLLKLSESILELIENMREATTGPLRGGRGN